MAPKPPGRTAPSPTQSSGPATEPKSVSRSPGPSSKQPSVRLCPLCVFCFYLFIYLFIYLFLAVLGLRFCARAFSSCGKRGPLFIAVRGPLTVAASLVAEHRLQLHRLSSCGSRAQLLRGMWDPPRPGLEPVSPALADSQPLRHQGSPHCVFLISDAKSIRTNLVLKRPQDRLPGFESIFSA